MVGSSSSIAFANYVLNTIVADTLMHFAERLEHSSDFDGEINAIIHDTMKQHGRVIFNGNNYTEEWVEEAKKRGLPNLASTVDAAKAFLDPKNIDILNRHHILSETECYSRYEVLLENYTKVITIEANTMLEMVHRQILPACFSYLGEVADSYSKLQQSGIYNESMYRLLEQLSKLVDHISDTTQKLSDIEQIPNELDSFQRFLL